MKDKRTDKINQLKEFRVQLDKEALWAELESRQKKEQRRWIFWLLPGVVLLGCLLLGLSQMNESAMQLPATTSEKVNEVIVKDQRKEELTSSAKKSDENIASSNLLNNSKTSSITNTSINTTILANQNKQPTIQQTQNENLESPILKTSLPSTTAQSTTAWKRDAKSKLLSNHNSDNLATTKKANNNIDTKALRHQSQASLPLVEAINSVITEALQTLQGLTSYIETENRREVKSPFLSYNPKTNILPSTLLHSRSFLELYTGVGSVHRELADPTKPYDNYTNIRAATETPLDAFHLGINYGRHLGKQFYISAGMEFSQITERFSFTNFELTGTETRDSLVTNLYVDAAGFATSTLGTGTGTVYSNVNYVLYNRYRNVTIPLTAGWRITTGKWAIGLSAGVDFSLAFGFKGTILDTHLDFDSNPSLFRNRAGLSWTAGLDIGYRISEDFSLFLRPSFRSVPNIIDDTQSSAEQLYKLYRVGLGLRYCL